MEFIILLVSDNDMKVLFVKSQAWLSDKKKAYFCYMNKAMATTSCLVCSGSLFNVSWLLASFTHIEEPNKLKLPYFLLLKKCRLRSLILVRYVRYL